VKKVLEEFLNEQQVSALKIGHRRCKEKRFADRMKAILLLNTGFSFQEVAEILLMDDDTVRRYRNIYEEEGIEGLMQDFYIGSSPLLYQIEIAELVKHIENHTYLSAKEVCQWVKEKFNVMYSVSGMTALLHRLNFVYKKPKIVPGKADAEQQKKFVRLYRRIKANKADEDQIYFADGCHPMLNPIAGYGWIKKGTQKEIPSNTGREHLNLNGAYNPQTGEAIVIESQTINAQSTIELFEKIQRKQCQGKIYFISDNARYYRSLFIKEYLRKHHRIKIIPLPVYSPNLNLIERLWHFYKKKILYHTHYENIKKLREATFIFFENLRKYRSELTSLMTENFQIIKPNFSEIYL